MLLVLLACGLPDLCDQVSIREAVHVTSSACTNGHLVVRVRDIGSLEVHGPPGAPLALTVESYRLEKLDIAGVPEPRAEDFPCDWGWNGQCQRWSGEVVLPARVGWIDAWRR